MTYNNRGWAYYCLKQYERAIQDFSKAIQLNSNYALAYTNRGTAYKKLGNISAANSDFEESKRIRNK